MIERHRNNEYCHDCISNATKSPISTTKLRPQKSPHAGLVSSNTDANREKTPIWSNGGKRSGAQIAPPISRIDSPKTQDNCTAIRTESDSRQFGVYNQRSGELHSGHSSTQKDDGSNKDGRDSEKNAQAKKATPAISTPGNPAQDGGQCIHGTTALSRRRKHQRDCEVLPQNTINNQEVGGHEIITLEKRLSDAAYAFWPYLSKQDRDESVANTIVAIMERSEKGEFHTISWWAKFMFGRSISRYRATISRETQLDDIAIKNTFVLPNQISHVAALEAIDMLQYLPLKHRRVMELRMDGASPMEIAQETGLDMGKILAMITDARLWLGDGGAYLDTEKSRTRKK